MKLYTFPWSTNARKVEMVVHALGIELEREVVDLAKGEQRAPAYVALNPNGRVPLLVDGDLALSESNAIMMYLADKVPNNTLLPTEPHARYDVLRWLFWQASHWSAPMGGLNFENMLKKRLGLGEPDPGQVQRHGELVRQLGGRLDQHLSTRTWVSGEHLTLADIAIVTALMYTVPAKIPVGDFAHIQRWFGQIRALDAWQKTEPPAL
jgi:glutathione S-transferase